MQLANLVLRGAIFRGWHDLFATAGGGQRALRDQPALGEQLVGRNAMPARHQTSPS